jgi:transitional endoplasmic reticulum ATPase
VNFISVRGAQFLSKYYGESERAIRELFHKARASAPCIVFFDEIDALLPRRDADGDAVSARVVGQFLAEMDGASSLGRVVILGATNRPDALDAALLRAGRFEEIVEFGLPNARERLEILRVHLRSRPHDPDLALEAVIDATGGWSGAALALLVQRSALHSIRAALTRRTVMNDQISEQVLDTLPTEGEGTVEDERVVAPRIEAVHLEAALAELLATSRA